MWKLIGVISLLGFIVSFIMLIIKAITKKGFKKRYYGLGCIAFFILFIAGVANDSPDQPEVGAMPIIIMLIIVIGWISFKVYKFKEKQKDKLREFYPGCKIVEAINYYLIEKDGIILVDKRSLSNQSNHIKLSKINDVKIYEDGKEKSLGKAVVGGVTFGIVGALIGASMKTQVVHKMGVKIYTNTGFYDIKALNTKCKKDNIIYRNASRTIDQIYNILLDKIV